MNDMPTVSELLASGECSAQCLCGSESSLETCTCRCGGRFHGSIACSVVEQVDPRPWWIQCQHGGSSPSFMEQAVTVVSLGDFNATYRQQVALHGEFIGLKQHGRHGYEFEWDSRRIGRENPQLEAGVLKRFFALLELRKRSGLGVVGPDYARTGLIREREEALTIASMASECISGNPDGTMRAIFVLSGWRDPVEAGYNPGSGSLPPILTTMRNQELAW